MSSLAATAAASSGAGFAMERTTAVTDPMRGSTAQKLPVLQRLTLIVEIIIACPTSGDATETSTVPMDPTNL